MPILGIYASSNQSQYISNNSYESIATVSLSGTQSTITFSSIPSTYKHLQLRWFARCAVLAGGAEAIMVKFNSDSGTNYTRHWLQGRASSSSAITSGATIGSTSSNGGGIIVTTSNSNIFSTGIIDILDYTNTNKTKSYRSFSGGDANGVDDGWVWESSGLWFATPAAINTITLTDTGSYGFAQYSSFALYGVKG